MDTAIDGIFAKNGITQWGAVRARVFSEHAGCLKRKVPFVTSDTDRRINPFLIMPSVRSIIVYLIPYRIKTDRTNLSVYAKGADYHTVADGISGQISDFLKDNGYAAEYFCDNGVLDDRYLAYLAGLGFYGMNRMIINPVYGSYTFIGYIITDFVIEKGVPQNLSCLNCHACMRSCPGGAISDEGIAYDRCASYLTQKKGILTEKEKCIIKHSGYVWGCDICQSVCPHNENAAYTEIKCFKDDTVNELSSDDLNDFKEKFGNRAFSWRGAEIIGRNIGIVGK